MNEISDIANHFDINPDVIEEMYDDGTPFDDIRHILGTQKDLIDIIEHKNYDYKNKVIEKYFIENEPSVKVVYSVYKKLDQDIEYFDTVINEYIVNHKFKEKDTTHDDFMIKILDDYIKNLNPIAALYNAN